MNASNPLSPDQLRVGLSQLLRSYELAGIKRIDTSASAAWAAGFTQQLAALQASPARPEAAAQATPTVASQMPETARPQSPAAVQAEAAAAAHAAPAPLLAAEASAAVPQLIQWQRPALSLPERQQQLEELNAQVRACRKCEELVCYRRQTVFGEGNLRPRVCFYGEAPGADEDAQGRPFVGAAGQLLTDIIRAMKLKREEVYILNSLKCRPPQNRTPLPQEVENCRPYALAQLEILQPEFIILLGAVAVRSVLESTDSVGRLRGRFHQFHGARVLVTYHPAYLLRNASAKKMVWTDVQLVMRELGLA